MGRPSNYDPAFCERVKTFGKEGATDLETADYLEISVASLYRYKAEYPAFCEALKQGKAFADHRVEESLYHKAVGYTFDSEEIRVLRDGTVVRVPVREHVPPDTTAAIFWLKNRQPERWRDKTDHELTGKVEVTGIKWEVLESPSEVSASLPAPARASEV